MTFQVPPKMTPGPVGQSRADLLPPGFARSLLRLLLLLPAGMVALRRGGRLRRALDQSGRNLHQVREQFDTLFKQAPVGICQADLSGRVLIANDRYCALLGRDVHALQCLTLHGLTHPDDQDRQQAGHARMVDTGEPFFIEKRYLRPDGTEVWVVSHLSVTRDQQGRPQHVIAADQDISHRRAADEALRAMYATLEQRVADAVAERARVEETLRHLQRMEALGQLAGGVAHDFNNVLQAIAGGARLIQRRPDDPAAVQRLAGLVVDAADRGASVTRRLLAFARRDETLAPGPVDVAALLDEMQEMLSRTLGSGIQVQVQAAPDLPPVLADRGGLETALVNLAANARDAMLGDDGLPRPGTNLVVLGAGRDDGAAAGLAAGRYVLLEVRDTGPGMAADTLSHAAEPFFTTKPRGRGTGLGLPVARGFAEQSGGRLLIDSQTDAGTTVRIWLPAAPVAAAAGTAGEVRRPRILVVDDDEDVRDVMRDAFLARGCEVFTHPDAAAALRGLAEVPPDVLISDLSMPGADGLSLIRAARERFPDMPAILLTGYAEPALLMALDRIGGPARLVQKPVGTTALMAEVAGLLPAGIALGA